MMSTTLILRYLVEMLDGFFERLQVEARWAILIGFDFPIIVPRLYPERVTDLARTQSFACGAIIT